MEQQQLQQEQQSKPKSQKTTSFPEEVLEHLLSFLDSSSDLNSVSLVSKSWYEIDRWSRKHIFIGNCYSVSPDAVVSRFKDVRSVTIKGKPHFADFNLVPDGWGAYALPWIRSFSVAFALLKVVKFKRMVVTDEALDLIAKNLKGFRVLVLCSCDGFSTHGLASIAANCRNLRTLDLCESEVDDQSGNWISDFPDSYTCLESLNIACLGSELRFCSLERLVSRSPNLKSLRLNRTVPLEKLANLLEKAPQLTDFGTGSFLTELNTEAYSKLTKAFTGCKGLKGLSGLYDLVPTYLPVLYPVCSGLTSLNLSYAAIHSPDLIELLGHCPKLQRLWVLDYIEDSGLEMLAQSCKDLHELRVFPSEPFMQEPNVCLTEDGLVSVAMGCPKLQSVLYFCRQFSNEALFTIAKNRPNLTRFRLCIIEPQCPDYLTNQPLDDGFGAIVEHCKDLKRLSLSGLLTDRVFQYIGTHAKKLEMLSLAFAGESDYGLHCVLSGCKNLRKLEIRDCPFSGRALLVNAAKLETMRSLWMSSCHVSYEESELLGKKMLRVNVEVMDERGFEDVDRPDDCPVEKLYIYRSLVGPRLDTPKFVQTINKSTVRSLDNGEKLESQNHN